jgi:hypothetical protein
MMVSGDKETHETLAIRLGQQLLRLEDETSARTAFERQISEESKPGVPFFAIQFRHECFAATGPVSYCKICH